MQDNLLQNQQQSATAPGRKNSNLDKDNLSPDSKVFNATGKAGFKPASRSLAGAFSSLGSGSGSASQMKSANQPVQQMVDKDVKEEEKKVQMKAGNGQSTGGNTASQSGSLPSSVLGKMEGAFNTSFSDVKVHNNSYSATNMGALAYAQGNDVHFAPGQYNPNSTKGQELIGHELTHVVQQRQGRVKANTQAKGTPVNDDPRLEKEADDMGKKAAQGKFANVAGSSAHAVQKQEDPKIDVLAEDNTLTDDVIVPGMNYLGKFQYDHTFGRDVRYVLTGTKEQWATILKYADEPNKFTAFVHSFLQAAVDPSWINKKDENQFRWNVVKEISRAPSQAEILEFLKALYGVDVNTELDLADAWYEQPSLGTANHVINNPMLAEFIEKYQGLLITEVSSKAGEQFLDEGKVSAIAEQGTTGAEVASRNPVVVKAMIQNALATALSASKIILERELDPSSPLDVYTAYDMIANSGRIIKSALSGYDKQIKQMQKNAESIFDHTWGLIPAAKNPALSIVISEAKNILKSQFVSALSLDDTSKMKSAYADKFPVILRQMAVALETKHSDKVPSGVFAQHYSVMDSRFRTYLGI